MRTNSGLALVAVLAPCLAQQADIRVQVPLIVAPTTVVDARGRFVNGLKAADFTLFDNGRPQRIQDDIAFEPVSLVLAVQCGGNIRWALPKVQRIANVVDALVVGEGGEAALIAFDYRVRTLQTFTQSSRKIAAGLETLYANGKKYRLFDAVGTAAALLNTRPAGRRRILLLISESRDRGSEAKLAAAILNLQAANVSLYAVVMNHLGAEMTEDPNASVPPPHAILLDQPLAEAIRALHASPVAAFTQFTGGRQYSFLKQRALESALSAIGDEIHGQYLLSYVPDNWGRDGFHEIRVSVNRPAAAVRTRPGYWLPQAE
ncbi:MAG: VWA domain-containing protein [Bryobacteraceae bacterium]